MSKSIPTLQKYMTTVPMTISEKASIREALEVMNAKNFRHLPVERAGKVWGLLSERDIQSVLSFAGTDANRVRVGDVCTDQVYVAKPNTPIDQAAAEMAEKKFGCAVVVDNHKLVGIFTTTDALRALADLATQRHH